MIEEKRGSPHIAKTIAFLGRVVFVALLTTLGPGYASAQDPEEMLIANIAGNSYVMRNFDKAHQEKDRQRIKAGELRTKGERLELPIIIYSYDANGRVQDSSSTVYSCSPGQKQMLAVVLPFALKRPKSTIKITDVNAPDLYPDQWNGITPLPDRTLKLDIEGGWAGFFGARSEVVYADRLLTPTGSSTYTISGTLTISSYAWGINVSTIIFKTSESVERKVGLVHLEFRKANGEHSTIELEQKN